MSAVNTSLNDREHEALRRAQRAHEPSMEEILASIRSIITEEREPARPVEPKSAPAKAGGPQPSPQVVYSKFEASPPPAPAAEPEPVRVVWRQPEPKAEEPPPASAADERLLSRQTEEAVASSFDALSANLAVRSAERAEALAREMLRPMLKTWLDENLPGIVERLVQAEIERVVRGAR